MKKRSHLFWFLFITVVFVATRILALKSAGSFWFDEAFSVHFANKPFSEIWTFLQFEHNPLTHFLSLHFWMNLFGPSELSARSLSAFAGLGSLFTLYWVTKTFFSKQAGLWAMFFMTISTLFLYHQTEARMYSLIAFFALISIGSFWRYYQQKSGSRGQGSATNLWLLIYLLSTTFLVHTHITAWILPVAILGFWFMEERNNLFAWKAWLSANVIVLASFFLWFIPVIKNKFLAGHISQGWFFFQQDSGFFLSHLNNYLMIGESSLLLKTMVTGLSLGVFFLAFIQPEKPSWLKQVKHFFNQTAWPFSFSVEWTKEIRLMLWILLIATLFGLGLKVTVTKYLLVAGLAVIVLLAKGMTKLPMAVQIIVACFFIIGTVPMQTQLLFSQRHHWDEVAMHVEQLDAEYENLKIVTHSFVWGLPLRFYLDEQIELTPFYPLSDDLTTEERIVRYNWQGLVNSDNVEILTNLIAEQEQVLLISSTPNSDERDPVKQWFYQRGWKLQEVQNWKGYGDPELLLFIKE